MKRLMMTVAAVALSTSAAIAMTPEQLRESLDQQLNEFAPEVEVETLTDEQVVQAYVVVNDGGMSVAEKSGAIGEIVEGTNAEVYAEMAEGDIDLTVDANSMREKVQTRLDISGFDYDVSELTDEEVVELATAFNSGESPADIENAVTSAFES